MSKVNSRILNVERGFSTVEILVALFVFSTLTASAFMFSFGSQFSITKAKIYQELLAQAQEATENNKAVVYKDVSGFEVERDDVKINSEVSLLYDFSKKIKTRVFSLVDKNLRPVELPLLISNWSESIGASTCFRTLPPAESYSKFGELDLQIDYAPKDIDVVRGKAYITANGTTGSDNFFIADVSDKNSPILLSEISTKNTGNEKLHVVAGYAFVANDSKTSQLQVINLADFNTTNFRIISDDPEIPNPGQGISVLHNKNKIYLGTAAGAESGPEFHIVNVVNPAAPFLENSWDIGNRVNDIVVENNFAFLASVNPYPLRVVDIGNSQSEPLKIFVESSDNESQAGQNLFLLDNFLALGRSVFSRHPDYHEFLIFDMKQPTSPEIIDSFHLGQSVRGLVFRENLIVLATTWGSKNEISFFDFDGITLTENSHKIGLPGKPTALDCENDVLYVVTEAPSKLLIIAPK